MVAAIARSVIRKLPPSFEVEDLVQEGMIGLLEAHERFNPEFGVPFAVYASHRVRGAMLVSVRRRQYRNATHEALEDVAQMSPILELIEMRQRTTMVAKAVSELPERERKVIEFRAAGMKMKQIGARLGVTEMRAIQIRQRAEDELRGKLAA